MIKSYLLFGILFIIGAMIITLVIKNIIKERKNLSKKDKKPMLDIHDSKTQKILAIIGVITPIVLCIIVLYLGFLERYGNFSNLMETDPAIVWVSLLIFMAVAFAWLGKDDPGYI